MRFLPLLVLLALPTVAVAQTTHTASSADNSPREAGYFVAAPVPSVVPPSLADAVPASPAEITSPPGVGNNIAGPADATPFSSTPSANMPPDAAMPNERDIAQGGAGAVVPNLSR